VFERKRKPEIPSPPSLDGLTTMLAGMTRRDAAYQQAVKALTFARRRQRELSKASPPDMMLVVQRELLESGGDASALAAFDAEHGGALTAQQQAREAHEREVRELPSRIAALEQIIQQTATDMTANTNLSLIGSEAQKLFRPYAERVKDAGAAYVEALRQARTAAATLTSRLQVSEHDIYGTYFGLHKPELMEDVDADELLPTMMAGIDFKELRDLNERAQETDDELSDALQAQLKQIGATGTLRIYRHNPAKSDQRIYAPDTIPLPRREDSDCEVMTVYELG